MSNGNTGAWAVIGKIAVVVGILVGAIQIARYWSTDGPVITAKGALYPVHYSERVFRRYEIEAGDVRSSIPYDLKDRDKIADEIAKDLSRMNSKREIVQRLDLPENNIVLLNITNEGNREAQDLTIEFDTSGSFELARVGEAIKRGDFDHVIQIGNLRPNNTTSLYVWPKYFTEFSEDDVKVVHTLGSTKVDFAMPINGWLAWPYRNPLFMFFAVVIIGFGVFFFGAFVEKSEAKSAAKKASTASKPSNEQTPANEEAPESSAESTSTKDKATN
jgi:hypothetical protein